MRRFWQLCLLGSLVALGACSQEKEQDESRSSSSAVPALSRTLTVGLPAADRIHLQVQTAEISKVGQRLTLTGTLDINRDKPLVKVAAPGAGIVSGLDTGPGDPVEKGQRLAQVAMTPVRSPLYGAVAATLARNGDNVAAGQALLTLLDLSDLTAYLDLYDPAALRAVYIGERVALSDPNRPRRPWEGQIRSIAPQIDPQTGATILRVAVSNKTGLLKPGMPISAYLIMPGTEEGLVVPQEAIVFDSQGGSWIYIQVKPGSYVRQPAEVVFLGGDQVVVRRGLKVGQVYVTVGAQDLFSQEFSGQIDTED